jgi:methylated-DNA-[protein]-cysteine S-methyltransferase
VSAKPRVCVELERDLVAAATREADASTMRRVGAHLERCPPCRAEHGRYRQVEDELGALRGHLVAERHVGLSRDRLEARLADIRSRLVAYRVFPSPVGPILLARSEQGVLLVEYLGRRRRPRPAQLGRLRRFELVEGDGETEVFARELSEYLEGRRTRLDWPLDLRLVRGDFHREVLRRTAEIPYGAVVSYAGLAHEVGKPRAVRAAAQALRWNPVPIVIPCHRVVGSSGALTGYAGGTTERKQHLLAIEGIPTRKAGHDFHIRRDAMYVLAPGDSEYCLPTCASVDPFPRGGVLFASRQRAELQGLMPCTTCRPDLHPLAVPAPA